jgi:hypothetical protein
MRRYWHICPCFPCVTIVQIAKFFDPLLYSLGEKREQNWNKSRGKCVIIPRRHSLTWSSDENGRKNPISTFVSIFFWRKRERVRKIRVRKQNRNMQTYGNRQIRMESQKIKLRSHNLIFSKYTYIKSCNNIYKV